MIINSTNVARTTPPPPEYTYDIVGLTQEEYDYIFEAVNNADHYKVDGKFDDGLAMRVYRELQGGQCG